MFLSRKRKIQFDIPKVTNQMPISNIFQSMENNIRIDSAQNIPTFIKISDEKQIKQSVIVKNKEKYTLKQFILRVINRSITTVVLGCFVALFIVCYILWQYGRDLPDYYYLKNYQPASITKVYDRFQNQIKEYADERRIYVPLAEIPSRLSRAFIAAEDKNFYTHLGIDPASFLKAVFINTVRKSWKNNPIGASTITQQVAKIFLVGNERSLSRKIKEAILAFRLEHTLGKDRILELYLNQIYLGASSYGVAIAAQSYFDKQLDELSIAECALLASLPKAPSQQDPFKNPDKAIRRRNWVLQRMMDNQIISLKEFEIASKEPLIIYKNPAHALFDNSYFLEEIRRELIRNYGEKETYRGGLEVVTTMHPEIQKIVEYALHACLEKYDRRHGWRGPLGMINLEENWEQKLKKYEVSADIAAKPAVILNTSDQEVTLGFSDHSRIKVSLNVLWKEWGGSKPLKNGDVILVKKHDQEYRLFQVPLITGGIVALDAETGEVLGLDGGYSFGLSQFNCATQAWRQPASTFKPFVYLAALEQGFLPSSMLEEKPVSIPTASGFYTPHNYNRDSYGGYMSLYTGLTKSRNVLTVILAHKIGIKKVINVARKMGVGDYFPNELGVALGTIETTVLKMASAFAPFFNDGYYIDPKLFMEIKSKIQPDQFRADEIKGERKRVISTKNAKYMKSMLAGVITEGTGKHLTYLMDKFPIKIYGKTGTSNDFKDAWFIGCVEPVKKGENSMTLLKHPIVFGVFVGFPIPKPLGMHESGSKVALPAAEVLIQALCTHRASKSE